MKTLCLFIAVSLAVGAAALGAAYLSAGEETLVQAGAAFVLAFIPAAVSLAFVLFGYHGASDMKLLASLGGSGFRMAIALGGGFLLTNTQPQSFDTGFWYWLLAFYMGLLGFEIALVVRQQPDVAPAPSGSGAATERVVQS